MAAMKIRRKAATPKGFLRRVEDAGLKRVSDKRKQPWVVHPMATLLKLGVLALGSHARSTRAVENRSEQLRPTVRAAIGLRERVSDNAFGLALQKVDWCELRRCLHRHIKAEKRRKRLAPTRLSKSTVAIDGKHVATLEEKRLRALVGKASGLNAQMLSADELRRALSTLFPYVQLQESTDGKLRGLIRVHRATLISTEAALVIDQWPIKGHTNEWGTIELSLSALLSAYGRTKLVERVTVDAGNATPEAAALLANQGVDYFMAIKEAQGKLHQRALDEKAKLRGTRASFCTRHDERGQTICYSVWQTELDDSLGFDGAKQVFRIERVAASDEKTSVGNRYFVSSEDADDLSAQEALELARAHWRCENEGHWTADAIFDEDARRTPWTKHPDGVLVVGLLRAMAINILAILRALSRHKRGETWLKPTWKTVIEQALLVLCEPLLDMEAFCAFDD